MHLEEWGWEKLISLSFLLILFLLNDSYVFPAPFLTFSLSFSLLLEISTHTQTYASTHTQFLPEPLESKLHMSWKFTPK